MKLRYLSLAVLVISSCYAIAQSELDDLNYQIPADIQRELDALSASSAQKSGLQQRNDFGSISQRQDLSALEKQKAEENGFIKQDINTLEYDANDDSVLESQLDLENLKIS